LRPMLRTTAEKSGEKKGQKYPPPPKLYPGGKIKSEWGQRLGLSTTRGIKDGEGKITDVLPQPQREKKGGTELSGTKDWKDLTKSFPNSKGKGEKGREKNN